MSHHSRACTGENRKPVDQGTVVKRKQSTMPARKPSGADVVLQVCFCGSGPPGPFASCPKMIWTAW